MKVHMAGAMCALLFGVVVGCAQAPQGPSPEEMVAQATALDESFVDAFNRGDAAALSSLYWDSPDVVSFQPDVLEARGMTAISDGNRRMFSEMTGARVEITEAHQMPAGDVVVGWGLFRMTIPGPDGESIEMLGRFTDVKGERDGKWVYLLDHASVPLPPPAPPAEPQP